MIHQLLSPSCSPVSTSGRWGKEKLQVPGAHLVPNVSPAWAGLTTGQLEAAFLGEIPKTPSQGLWHGVMGETCGCHPCGCHPCPTVATAQLLHNPVTSSACISCETGTHRAVPKLSLGGQGVLRSPSAGHGVTGRAPSQGMSPIVPQNHHIVVREGSTTGIQNQTRWEEDTAGDTKSLRDKSHIPALLLPISPPVPAQSCPLPGVFTPQ